MKVLWTWLKPKKLYVNSFDFMTTIPSWTYPSSYRTCKTTKPFWLGHKKQPNLDFENQKQRKCFLDGWII
jgi:glycosidase